jgi:hypothetical protein
LNALATGILLFLFWDVVSTAVLSAAWRLVARAVGA